MRALLACTCLLLLLCNPAAARPHREESQALAGQFDYYLLSLSWSPAFCLESPGSPECQGPRHYGLIVHGLWPQLDDGSRIEHCAMQERMDPRVADGMLDLMPVTGLIYHEWSAHGSCSGLKAEDYFARVRRARAQFAVPERLERPAAPLNVALGTLQGELRTANPRFPDGSIVVTCTHQDVPRLREVRLCLDRDLRPRRCAADVWRAECRAPQLLIPPLR